MIVLCLFAVFALSGCGVISNISGIFSKKDQPSSEKSSQSEKQSQIKTAETKEDSNSLDEETASKETAPEEAPKGTKTTAESNIMPESVYFCFDPAAFKLSRVAVLLFSAPDYAPFVGFAASQSLYLRLKGSGVFLDALPEYNKPAPSSPEKLIEFARQNNYDMLITGAVTYYFDGSALQESRVDEVVKIISANTGTITCQAYASERGIPKKEEEYLRFFYKKNEPAPPTSQLMDMNSIKFLTLFSSN